MADIDDFDIILFSGKYWWPSYLIEWVQGSPYSHIGIVLKKPTYIHPNLTGIYLLEAGQECVPDAEDGKKKFGVQITELNDLISRYNGGVYIRKLNYKDKTKLRLTMNIIHGHIHNKPYDSNLLDLMRAATGLCIGNCNIEERFFCSALVTYVLIHLGLLDKDIAWSLIEPKDYGKGGKMEEKLKELIGPVIKIK